MNLTLKIWRQKNADTPGKMVDYKISDVSPDMSFLEMLDVLNVELIEKGEEPVSFDHDCREGICGSCSLYINGEAHGPDRGVTTCQLHMRKFKDGDTIYIEPFRAKAFPIRRRTRSASRSGWTISAWITSKAAGRAQIQRTWSFFNAQQR